MEVCKGQAAPRESDMAHPDPDTFPGVGSAGWPRAAAVERIEHVGIRDAKVREPNPPECASCLDAPGTR